MYVVTDYAADGVTVISQRTVNDSNASFYYPAFTELFHATNPAVRITIDKLDGGSKVWVKVDEPVEVEEPECWIVGRRVTAPGAKANSRQFLRVLPHGHTWTANRNHATVYETEAEATKVQGEIAGPFNTFLDTI